MTVITGTREGWRRRRRRRKTKNKTGAFFFLLETAPPEHTRTDFPLTTTYRSRVRVSSRA